MPREAVHAGGAVSRTEVTVSAMGWHLKAVQLIPTR